MTEKSTIDCEAVFDESRSHRFIWKRVWKKDLPIACVITLNPNSDDCFELDLTSMLILNNVYRLQKFGGVCVVNLFSKITGKLTRDIWLEKNGIHHNPKTILRVMQKYNLLSVIRRKKYRNYGDYLHRYPNLLNRDFKADRPNQKWVTDISYIKTQQGTLYLSVIRDLYDNSIVAYKTGTEQNINLVLSTIRAAKKKEKVTAELQLHSDQGFQYTSHGYFKLTQSYGITPSMSRRGNPYDNAMAENFFSILKTECIYRAKLKTYEDARILINEYIHFYNNDRIQLKTKLTPLEKRSQYVA